jgi:hypothetical protein
VEEVPLPEEPFHTSDEQAAFPGEDEKGLLLRLGVVEALRPARLQHAEIDAELPEPELLALEPARRTERLRRPPLGVPHVHHEPAVTGGCEA